MSQFKKMALKMGVVGLVLWGGYSLVNHTAERAEATAVTTEHVVETTLDTSDLMLNKSGEAIDGAVLAVSDSLDNLDVKGKVGDLQDSAAPIGKFIKKTVNPNNIPGVEAAGWADNHTSFPAMLLALVALITLSMMMFASPSSLSGGRH